MCVCCVYTVYTLLYLTKTYTDWLFHPNIYTAVFSLCQQAKYLV